MIDFSLKFNADRIGINNHLRLIPEKPALIMGATTITFRELDRVTTALANGLLQCGIRSGDRISILMNNSPEIIQVCNATAKIGVTPIALNYRFKTDELAYIINDSESSALIYGHKFEEMVEATKSKFASPSLIYIHVGNARYAGILNLEDVIGSGRDLPPPLKQDAHGVSSALIYTSGTTGRPKGVFKTSKKRIHTLMGYAHTFESTYDDTHLVAGPLYHAAPYAWAAFSAMLGNTIVIMPRFDAQEFLFLVEKYKITTTFVVPTMLNRILSLADSVKQQYDLSKLRVLTMGGESCPFPLKKRAVQFFSSTRIFEFYGGTEASVVTYLRPEDQIRKAGSCGRPVLGTQLKLLDEAGTEVPDGDVGLLYMKNSFLMDYYYKNPEATEACYHDGFLTLGDMARKDDEGYYYIVDRAVDMVLSGGVNIYPAEIEEVLHNHPHIYDVAVIGAPDPDWGEKLVAFVVPAMEAKISAEEIQDYVATHLATYKKPRQVFLVDEIPYSPSGKKLKRVLRKTYAKMSEGGKENVDGF